jgi:hypothetical protein
MAGRDLPRRAREVWSVMTNSRSQRGVALLKLNGHPVGISEVSLRRFISGISTYLRSGDVADREQKTKESPRGYRGFQRESSCEYALDAPMLSQGTMRQGADRISATAASLLSVR